VDGKQDLGASHLVRFPQEGPDMDADLITSRWYSTEELAELLGVDPSSVRRWRTSRPSQGPPFVRLSARYTIYSAADVEAWLQSRRIDPGRTA